MDISKGSHSLNMPSLQADPTKTFFVTVTGIIIKDGKFLIAKRSDKEKMYPGQWTVPGGKFQTSDYTARAPNSQGLWYEVLESGLRREIKEEVGVEVEKIRYVTSITYVRPDGMHCLILSYACDYTSGDVTLCPALTEHAWVTLEDAKKYDLIAGIYDEIVAAERMLHGQGF